MVEIVIQGPQAGVAAHQSAQVPAHLDQGKGRAGRVVDAAKQLLAGRFDGAEQLDHFLVGIRRGAACARPTDGTRTEPVGIDAVRRGDVLKKRNLPASSRSAYALSAPVATARIDASPTSLIRSSHAANSLFSDPPSSHPISGPFVGVRVASALSGPRHIHRRA